MVSSFLSGATGGATVAIVIKAVDKYSKEFKSATTVTQRFMKVAKVAALAGAAAFTAFTVSAVKAGLKMKPIEDSFRKLAKASDKFLLDLNEATKGTVSNFELMSNANKALLLGLDQEALPKLFKNAAIVGRAAGRTTTEAIQDITLGIGRQSRLILDNLGIILKAEDVYKDFAESIGKATSELTQQEKQTAFNAAAMEALQESADKLGGVIPEDAITDIQQLTAGFANFNAEFGKAFIENFGIVLPKAEKDWQSFGRTTGQVVGAIGSAVVLTVRVIELVIRTFVGTMTVILGLVATAVAAFVNQFVEGINIVIRGLNLVKKLTGGKRISLIEKVNVSSGFFESATRQFERAGELSKTVGGIGGELNQAFKNIGTAPIPSGQATTVNNINIENVNGLDAENVSRALSDEINNK